MDYEHTQQLLRVLVSWLLELLGVYWPIAFGSMSGPL